MNDTTVVSLTSAGEPANGSSGPGLAVSADGRYVVFESTADNLSDADDDGVVNIYLRDRQTGITQLVSRATGPSGAGADADSTNPAISPEGGYVAFESRATNLSDLDGDTVADVFLRDLASGATTLISRAPDGSAADQDSGNPSLSAGAAVVAFESLATNLTAVDNDSLAIRDVYTYDRAAGTMSLVSRPKVGTLPADGSSYEPSISSDGRRIAFASDANNLHDDDRDGFTNVYVAEPFFRLLTHVSRSSKLGVDSDPANRRSWQPVISSNGAYVAFVSEATNLAGGVALAQVFRHELSAGKTDLVSRADGGLGAMGEKPADSPSISANGRFVAFASTAPNLGEAGAIANPDAPVAPVEGRDVYVRDLAWGNTVLLSRASDGTPFERDSYSPALSGDATLLGFTSDVAVAGEIRSLVYARELQWREPPPPAQLPEGGHGHGDGHGDGGHMDAGGHGDAHGGSAGHAHGPGSAHFTLRTGGLNGDRMFGTALHDKICGGGGNDEIELRGGPDVGYGGLCGSVEPPVANKSAWWRDLSAGWRHAGDKDAAPKSGPGRNDNDRIAGGKGDDALFGGPGSDRLVGGTGSDYLSGGSGHDRLVGGPGRNRIEAGGGSDSINSANGRRELVDCGFGRDTVKADRRDVLSGCERVKIARRKAKKELPELLPECPGGGHACHEGQTMVLSRVIPAWPAR